MITALRHTPPLQRGLCAGRFELPVTDPQERLSALLDDLRSRHLRMIYSSPSLRCSNLAALLAVHLGVTMYLDRRLLELDFGEWEGRAWNDITREEREEFHAWSANWQHTAPPGGETADSLERRIAAFIADLRTERVLVVTHAGPIRALRVVLTGCSWSDAMTEAVPHGLPVVIAAPRRF